jgi:hypothetical protein
MKAWVYLIHVVAGVWMLGALSMCSTGYQTHDAVVWPKLFWTEAETDR